MMFRDDDDYIGLITKTKTNKDRKARRNRNENQKDTIIKIATYIRVSTKEQAEGGHSLYNQELELYQYIHNHHLFLNKEIKVRMFSDEGVSAKSIKHRKGLMNLLQVVQDRDIDYVFITKLDRLTRKVIDLYRLIEFFEQFNVGLLSVHESLETKSASGRAFIGILGVMAQLEKEQTAERTYDVFKGLVKKQFLGGTAPYGYIYVSKNNSSQHIPYLSGSHYPPLKLNDIEELIYPGFVVKEIFEYYLSYQSFTEVATKLTQLGIPTPQETYEAVKRFLGQDNLVKQETTSIEVVSIKEWNSYQVKYILTNPFYIGVRLWNRFSNKKHKKKDKSLWIQVNNAYPPLVSKELFNQVLEIIYSKRGISD